MLEDRPTLAGKVFRFAIGAYIFTLVLAMYPYTNDPTGDIKRLITAWAALLLGGGWAAVSYFGGIPFRRPRVFFELHLILLAFFVLGTLQSGYPGISLMEFGRFFALFAVYLVASQVYRTAAQVQRLFFVMCMAVLLSSFYGFAQKAGYDPFPWDTRESDVYSGLPATFGNPNFAAHTLILTIIMGISLAWHGFRMRKGEDKAADASTRRWIFCGWVVGIFLIHLYYTTQRAGIIALAASIVLVVAARFVGARLRRPVAGAMVSIVLTGVIGAAGLAGAMWVAKAKTGSAFPLDVSLLLRYQSYVSASNMVLDRPLLGHGPGVYKEAYPVYWTRFEQEWFAQELRQNAHVHNDLLELAIDAGLPAAGCYLAMLILGMSYGLLLALAPGGGGRQRLGYALSAIFCAYLVDGLFGFNLRVPVSAAVLYLMMGVLEGLVQPMAAQTEARVGWRAAAWRVAFAVLLLLPAGVYTSVFVSEYYLQRGMAAQLNNASQEARWYFESGERLAPWQHAFGRRLGQVALEERNYTEAIAHFSRSLETNPYFVLTNLPLAHAWMLHAQAQFAAAPSQLEQPVESLHHAAEHARRVLEICPMFSKAEAMLGQIYMLNAIYLSSVKSPQLDEQAARFWGEAEEHLLRAIEFGATNPAHLYRMVAQVRVARNRTDAAEEALARAAQADPSDVDTWPFFLDFAKQHRRYDRARDTLYEQIDRMREMETPDRDALATTYLWLANVLENGYDNRGAVDAAYASAVKEGPKRPEVWTNFARYAFERNRKEVLKQAVDESCAALAAEGIEPLPQVGAVHSVMKHGDEALDRATLALLTSFRTHPRDSALTAAQAYGWAVQLLLEAAGTATAAAERGCGALLNLGIMLAQMDILTAADEMFGRAMGCTKGKDWAFLAIHWADVMVRTERLHEARNLLSEAVRRYPDNFDARWALARTLAKLNEFGAAREVYAALLKQPNLEPAGRTMLEAELNKLPQ